MRIDVGGRALAVLLALSLLIAGHAGALGLEEEPPQSTHLGHVLYDAVLLRPMALVQSIVSAGFFVVAWPVALPFGAGNEVVDICLTQPTRRTFLKPLGQL